MMLSFEFVPTQKDYLSAYRAFYWRRWPIWVGLVVLMSAQILCIGSALLRGEPDIVLEILLPLVIFIVLAFYLVLVLVIQPQRTAGRIGKDKRLSSLVQYEANNEQLKYHNGFSESRVYWRSFHKVLETEEHFLLIYTADKNRFQIIPKRAFTSAEDEEAFRELLDVQIPPLNR